MCLSGATCLPADCCFSELALQNLTRPVGLAQIRYHHHLIECNLFSRWYSCEIAHLALNNNHSPTPLLINQLFQDRAFVIFGVPYHLNVSFTGKYTLLAAPDLPLYLGVLNHMAPLSRGTISLRYPSFLLFTLFSFISPPFLPIFFTFCPFSCPSSPFLKSVVVVVLWQLD